MAAKKMGLGKGLDSMIPPKRNSIPDNFSSEENAAKSGETILKINEVEPNNSLERILIKRRSSNLVFRLNCMASFSRLW